MKKSSKQKNSTATFFYISLLTVLFIVLESTFVFHFNGLYLGDFKSISYHLAIPKTILPGVFYFLFAQLLVHATYLFFIYVICLAIYQVTSLTAKQRNVIAIFLWSIGMITILLANRIYFVNSKYSTDLLGWLSLSIAQGLFYLCIVAWVLFLAAAIYGCIKYFSFAQLRLQIFTASVIILSGAFFFSHHALHPSLSVGSREKPNIIIIGIDSLRPDFLGFFGERVSQTPHFDRFLNKATVFSEAVTPLARTYPSWVSILTGLYPKITDVRTNLNQQEHMNFNDMLPAILRKQGYETIFAMDESRFSNIDERFGFDKVITPPIGFNDFLLGTLNDFPLSNLIINTKIGYLLFPHSYASRPVYITYQPESFLKLLQPVLAERKNKPIFLVTHFCLTHYPYAWQKLSSEHVTMHHYQMAIKKVDEQFDTLMHLLKQNHLLDHSIVILLSDHGEALELLGDRVTDPELYIPGKENKLKVMSRFYPPTATKEEVNQAGGHGTDVLSLPQYHTVLAIRNFGLQPNVIKTLPGLVSLLDVKPTLLNYLHLPRDHLSGHSLLDITFGKTNTVPTLKHFFVESDFSPTAIRSVHPETRKVLFEGIDYFKIDPETTRLVVRDSMYKLILSSKQFADYSGHWALALYPQKHNRVQPILVNLMTGQWTDDLTTSFAKQSPAKEMFAALKDFYGNDIFPQFAEQSDLEPIHGVN